MLKVTYFIFFTITLSFFLCSCSKSNNLGNVSKTEIKITEAKEQNYPEANNDKSFELDLFKINTSFSKEQIQKLYPDLKCENIHLYPDCEKYAPLEYNLAKSRGQIINMCEWSIKKWEKERKYFEVPKCFFTPDEFKEYPVNIIIFDNKVEKILRYYQDKMSFKGKKEDPDQLMKPMVDDLEKRYNTKAKIIQSKDDLQIFDVLAAVFLFKDGSYLQITSKSDHSNSTPETIDFLYVGKIYYDRNKLNEYLKGYFEKMFNDEKISKSDETQY